MEINLQGGVSPQATLPGANKVDFPVRKAEPTAGNDPQPAAAPTQEAVDARRLQQVQQAAIDFKDVYAVSDSKFTIYKDTTGQYITRYTSLRDGKVTYIPEPQLLQFARSHEPRQLVKIKA